MPDDGNQIADDLDLDWSELFPQMRRILGEVATTSSGQLFAALEYRPSDEVFAEVAESTANYAALRAAELNADKVESAVRKFKAQGYRVELYYMHVTPEESAMRVIKRFRDPNDRRFTSPRYALQVGDRPRQTYESVKQMLDPETDRWAFFDNMVPMGEKPRLMERGGKWD